MIHLREAISDALNTEALTALVGNRIFHQTAPQGTQYPFVVFQQQSGAPRWTFGGDPVERKLWIVKGIHTQSPPLEAIVDAIDDALDGALGLDSRRESDINYAEPADGTLYRHLGAIYRIWIA